MTAPSRMNRASLAQLPRWRVTFFVKGRDRPLSYDVRAATMSRALRSLAARLHYDGYDDYGVVSVEVCNDNE